MVLLIWYLVLVLDADSGICDCLCLIDVVLF